MDNPLRVDIRMRTFGWIWFIFTICITLTECLMCDRTMGMSSPRILEPAKFDVKLKDDPLKYVPGAIYTVQITGNGDNEKFSRFLLVAEPVNVGQGASAGSFRLKDDSLARFSEFCPNAVKDASEIPKSEVQILWIAPPVLSGCVFFRATVVKNNQQWYMDDEHLTRAICPEDEAQEDTNMEPCTACEEAKYELTFEGIWSSLTHPKDFPSNHWRASFSDLIGASHSSDLKFWEYGNTSSQGLQNMAENGDSKELERELREKSGSIRTIIKARGLRHTNYNGLKTFAVFRTDPTHNLISLVSKIDPSPDWFVGVSGLNLCEKNGSWVLEKEINLFPIDAGTDSGVSYMSPDFATLPRAEISRLVWSREVGSPFFDPDGNMLKPFAKVRIQQQRVYRRGSCAKEESYSGSSTGSGRLMNTMGGGENVNDDLFSDDSPDSNRLECAMSRFGTWSSCQPTCGKGSQKQTRHYINESLAREARCERREERVRVCYNSYSCKGSYTGTTHSETKVPSSRGFASGTQDQLNVYEENPKSQVVPENRNAQRTVTQSGSSSTSTSSSSNTFSSIGTTVTGTKPHTPTDNRYSNRGDPVNDPCGTTDWSRWTACLDPCGSGTREQNRTWLNRHQAKIHKCEARVPIRSREKCPRTLECRDTSPQQVEVGCETSDWGDWQPCTATCGKGVHTRDRIYQFSAYDHRKCTQPLQDEKECKGLPPCPTDRATDSMNKRMRHRPVGDSSTTYNTNPYSGGSRWEAQTGVGNYQGYAASRGTHASSNGITNSMPPTSTPPTSTHPHHHQHGYFQGYNDGPSIDCRLSSWSPWSACSVSCGRGWQYQSRYIEVFNENGGRPCFPRMERSRNCFGTRCSNNRHMNPHQYQSNSGPFNYMPDDYNYQE